MRHHFLSQTGWALAACTFIVTSALSGAEGILKSATFCHALEETQAPKGKAESFFPDQTVYLSVELKGRPKKGIAAARFLFREDLIARAEVDVATVNAGVLLSVGQNTFAGFNLTPAKPLPVGACYTAEVSFDGQVLGVFPFVISPPKEAIPTKLRSVALSKEVDDGSRPVGPAREFSSSEKVVFTGVADIGVGTWMEMTWVMGGTVDSAGTRSFSMKENKPDCPFHFTCLPAGGWPSGTHEAVLTINGTEAARERFEVKDGVPLSTTLAVASSQLLQSDAKGEPVGVVDSFTVADQVLRIRWKLKHPAMLSGVSFAWIQETDSEGKPALIAEASLESTYNSALVTTLRTKQGLPPGGYRAELIQDGKVLDARAFEVKP